MNMHEFIKWTATEAVAHLRQGDVTPLELIDAAEIQIAQTNPQINALVTLCMTRARERAQVLMRHSRRAHAHTPKARRGSTSRD
jgi:amidase